MTIEQAIPLDPIYGDDDFIDEIITFGQRPNNLFGGQFDSLYSGLLGGNQKAFSGEARTGTGTGKKKSGGGSKKKSGGGGFDPEQLFGLLQLLGGDTRNQQIQPAQPINLGGGLLDRPQLGSTEQGRAFSQLAQQNNFGTLSEAITPPESEQAEEPKSFRDRISAFTDNLNRTLSSPTKTMGLGLLGDIDPRLVYAGLLAAGLFDKEGGN